MKTNVREIEEEEEGAQRSSIPMRARVEVLDVNKENEGRRHSYTNSFLVSRRTDTDQQARTMIQNALEREEKRRTSPVIGVYVSYTRAHGLAILPGTRYSVAEMQGSESRGS